jgi:hypothetical protein
MSSIDLKKLEKTEQLKLARAKLRETGQSPTVIGKSNLLKTLLLIYLWGYTIPSIVQLFLGITRGGYLQKLTEQGWLRKVKTESGNPQAIYTLTESGVAEAERHAAIQIRYIEIDPYRINQQLLRHNLLAQEITINALISGVIDDYQSERMLSTQDKPGQKRVDACWLKSTTIKIGIEIELSKKWDRKLDQFVSGVINALENNIYNQFIIFSDSTAIIVGYSTAMKAGSPLKTWKKDQKGFWKVEKTDVVPDWLLNKVSFQLI